MSERLRELAAAGPLPFARFMEEALYGKGGYYQGGAPGIGRDGDFVTGSSVSPLFAASTVRLLERLDTALGQTATCYEVGYGDGAHLSAVAARRPKGSVLGFDRGASPGDHGFRIVAPTDLEAGSLEGLVFSYELFDALPVHRLVGREGRGPGELLAGLTADGEWEWVEAELSDPALAELLVDARLAPGQVADLAPGWVPLYHSLARLLARGAIVTFDYGFSRDRLLDARVRRDGTLACYRRHRVHRNPFVHVGEQDLTAHVDFSALRDAGEALGLQTLAFTRQARFLTALGIFDDLAGASADTRQEAMRLLDGGGMGDEIRVLVQSRGLDRESLFDPEIVGEAG